MPKLSNEKKNLAKLRLLDHQNTGARVAAAFARENAYELIGRLARDANVIADLAVEWKSKTAAGARRAIIKKLKALSAVYGAEVVLAGKSIGLRFAGGRFAAGGISPDGILSLA